MLETKKCLVCQKLFTTDSRHPYRKYCSKDCQKHAYKIKQVEMIDRVCILCGEHYTTTKRNLRKKFCSHKCLSKSQDLKRHPLEESIKKCEWCGKEFSTRLHNHKKIFCSNNCATYKSEEKRRLNKPERVFNQYVRNARIRNIEFNLSYKYFVDNFWHAKCTYCGDDIETAGVDRMNNSIGYEKSNCTPCCGVCNIMKTNHSTEFFINHIQKIINHTALVKPQDSIKKD